MHGLHCAAVCAILLCPTPLLASSVWRCEDGNGHVTFTLHGCPDNHSQQIQETYNPRPGSGAAVPLAKPERPRQQVNPGTQTAGDTQLTVVGERQDGCGNLVTGSTRREAIIRKQIRSGMTRNDVESALGKPQRTSRRNGQTVYHYADRQGSHRRTVTFDESGCVKGAR
ncbi:outer membrane protein assembly factor BamE domain-containing protein [Phytopseudomonas dryadis]|uniref:DUF4124 domain-containing protein n=1 Tax=Phytopseudomonas dryadis TaxID=2487520 RepID=A0ABY1Z9L6_9GAMM|nr:MULTISPECIES: outer membrane protein assembly factor BamE [Pseudomonas]TBV07890.1 DUF4124 domain-containing protein [Pseudomonas dryadis]TBV19285.1 DUF4124 domain-containing protein [Pseudomonas sp. FRB 230]